MRKPAPVIEGWIVFARHRNTIRHIETSEAFAIGITLGAVGEFSERFKPRKRQSDSCSAKEFPTVDR